MTHPNRDIRGHFLSLESRSISSARLRIRITTIDPVLPRGDSPPVVPEFGKAA